MTNRSSGEGPSANKRAPLRGVSVALQLLGCPKNDVDAEYMAGLLRQAGAILTDAPEQADVIIVNTCAFIQPAVTQALEALLQAVQAAAGRGAKVICAGCLTARFGEQLLEEIEEVDAFMGPADVPHVVDIVAAVLEGERKVWSRGPAVLGGARWPRHRLGHRWTAAVKIADGCSHTCTFCTIPSIRGPFRSRLMEDIIAEVQQLIDAGAREICLIAQDTTSYGRDIGMDEGLARLLERLAHIVGRERWIRVQYMHPDELTPACIDAVLGLPEVVSYFDLPLQHVSPRILRAMGRRGSGEDYLELLGQLRSRDPTAALRLTFIVGFPGETDEDFHMLLEFVDVAEPDHVAIFPYWPEEGTRAVDLPNRLPLPVVMRRQEELSETAEQIMSLRAEQFVGLKLPVLIEGQRSERHYLGRTFRSAPEVDAICRVGSDERLTPGEFVTCEILAADASDLIARPAQL